MAIWIAALIAILAVYAVLAIFVLPKLLFSSRYNIAAAVGRGMRKCERGDEKSIVYEPMPLVKKYISAYALSYRKGKRVLVCKLSRKLSYIDYDVVVFGSDDKVKSVFNVKDKVKGRDYTRVVTLPDETDYVSVLINEADDEYYVHNIVKNVSAWRVLLFILAGAAITALALRGVQTCLAYMFGGLYAEGFLMFRESNIAMLVILGIAVVFQTLVTLFALMVRNFENKVKSRVRK